MRAFQNCGKKRHWWMLDGEITFLRARRHPAHSTLSDIYSNMYKCLQSYTMPSLAMIYKNAYKVEPLILTHPVIFIIVGSYYRG